MGTRGSDAVSGPRFTWAAKALEQQPLKVAQHPCPRWAVGGGLAASACPSPAVTQSLAQSLGMSRGFLHFQPAFHRDVLHSRPVLGAWPVTI